MDETISTEAETDLQKSPLNEETKAISPPIFSNNGHLTLAADIVKCGQQVYEKLKDYLESRQFGRFVAIDPRSELYFLGDTGTEALVAAHTALPEARFFLARIGHKTAHRMGGHASRIG